MLWEGGHVDGHHDMSTHRKNVTASIGCCNGSEVFWVVNKGWEKIGGAHQRHIGAYLIHRRIVEWRQANQQRLVE